MIVGEQFGLALYQGIVFLIARYTGRVVSRLSHLSLTIAFMLMLRLARYAWSMVILLRKARNEYPPVFFLPSRAFPPFTAHTSSLSQIRSTATVFGLVMWPDHTDR